MKENSVHEARWLLAPLFSLCLCFVAFGVMLS